MYDLSQNIDVLLSILFSLEFAANSSAVATAENSFVLPSSNMSPNPFKGFQNLLS